MTTNSAAVARVCVLLIALVAAAVPARAQEAEASFTIGYTGSNGITGASTHLINGLPYNDLDVTSGFSFGFTAGYYFNEHMEVEFLFSRQSSTFQASNPSPALKVSDLGVFNYHGNFVYNWGTHDSQIRPYAFGGLGATHYSPSNDLLPPLGPGTTPTISSTTRFSTTWGGGVKFYPAKAVGARVGLRWTPTYIQSNAAGYWCDPWYGCWLIGSAEYSQQFEFSGGITFRFNFHQ